MAKILYLLLAVMWFMAGAAAYAQQQPATMESGPVDEVRKYTGIIKNNSACEVAVPSLNSGATLTVPAHGFIEYIVWSSRFEIIAYRGGQPVYCQKINASPGQYPFMCKNYDFIAEIINVDPDPQCVPKKRIIKRTRIPREPKAEG
ncbi:MAG: hypothetical protein FJ126_09775 [Deltaproteobacteria bacterium]|nr:hypothetical protein [Deltaproteobacteria bacterium]